MRLGDCQPLNCETAMACIEGARDPSVSPLDIGQLRGRIANCSPCLAAFDLEVRLRMTMTPAASDLPTIDFRIRITETLASIDLSRLEITDF
jgi:hypothetical protein